MTKFDINKFEVQCNIGEMFGMDDLFNISRVFEISKFDIAGLTCVCIMHLWKLKTDEPAQLR